MGKGPAGAPTGLKAPYVIWTIVALLCALVFLPLGQDGRLPRVGRAAHHRVREPAEKPPGI